MLHFSNCKKMAKWNLSIEGVSKSFTEYFTKSGPKCKGIVFQQCDNRRKNYFAF